MDISDTLIGKSTQLDNVDLMTGPRDFTITGVKRGNEEQPLHISLAEFPQPWKPGVTMRRLLAAIWGADASQYVGRKVRLYRDETVAFGTTKTGGTRISHASHLEKKVTVTLPISKGKFGPFTVQPLPGAPDPAQPALADRIAQAVNAFASLGVTVEQLTVKLGGRTPDAWTDADLTGLLAIYQSIQAGESTAADEFGGEQA